MSTNTIEIIPDHDSLYYRIHKNNFIENIILPVAFKPQGDAMSTEWDKYSNPSECLSRASNPANNGVVSLIVSRIRAIPPLSVVHSPSNRTFAHTSVEKAPKDKDPFKDEIRMKLRRISNWEIKPQGY